MDIFLNYQQNTLKLSVCVLHYPIEGTVSQIFYIYLCFCFIKSRKLTFKK